ncbi:MAG: hybrid sensor histidine kinase/response regulator [Myxococcaceae bacterium]
MEASATRPPAEVLIVDDHLSNLIALEAVLEPLGQKTVRASSGEQALKLLLSREFACILLDVQMPGLDGFETARLIRQRERSRHVPILFLTAISREDCHIVRGYASGAVDYLVKPYDPELLRAKVQVFVELFLREEKVREQERDLAERQHQQARERTEQERENLLQELQAAVKMRDEFLAVASHELKTPLTPLALKLQKVSRALDASPEVESAPLMRKDAELLKRQVKRLSALVNDLLDVSRFASGHVRLDLEELDLCEVANDVCSRFEAEADRAGCPLDVTCATSVHGKWDRLRVEQMLTNLLSNAFKYGTGKPVRVEVSADATDARITVRDEGIGIAPPVLGKIFDKFERGVSDRHYGGLGLGLYVTRQIALAMGGSVSAESTLGQGANFEIRLPLRNAPHLQTPDA